MRGIKELYEKIRMMAPMLMLKNKLKIFLRRIRKLRKIIEIS